METLRELALEYHERCESFDRTVCTGPVVRGEIMPIGYKELGAINMNARNVFHQLRGRAEALGFTASDLRQEIARAS